MELGFYRFANKEPNKLAIVVGPNEELVSRGELLSKANKLTHALRDLGLKKFDTVAVVLPNSVEYFVVYMACLQAGFLSCANKLASCRTRDCLYIRGFRGKGFYSIRKKS